MGRAVPGDPSLPIPHRCGTGNDGFGVPQPRDRPTFIDPPTALLDGPASNGKFHVIELTASARRRGVETGMSGTQALARCSGLRLLRREPGRETELQDLLLECAGCFSPDFEATAAGTATIDLLGSGIDPADLEDLGRRMVARLAEAGLVARAGIAENPDLALLAARLAKRATVVIRAQRGEVHRFLAPLPLEAAEPSVPLLRILQLWGITTFGEFTRLPREEVLERLGAEAMRLWEQATGGRPRLLKLLRAPTDFSQAIEIEHGIETLEPLLFLIRRILETLAARLAAEYLAAGEILLELTHDDGSRHRRHLRVPDPSGEVELLFGLLHTHLENFTAPAPIVGLRLELEPARHGRHQFGLFESSLVDPNRFGETLARLGALLGGDRVGAPHPLPTRRPDTFSLQPFAENPASEAPPSPLPPLTLGLPLRRFRPPLPVEVVTQHDPVHALTHPALILGNRGGGFAGRLHQRRGPWLGSGHWWEKREHWSREEWDVQLDDGRLLRLVRQAGSWSVEGVYG
ncbi:MAG: hypothetical protein ACC661_11135 [Verrucomicrobiales bacterium]